MELVLGSKAAVTARPSSAKPASRTWQSRLLPMGAALGAAACVWLAWSVGLSALTQGLSLLLPWVPLLVLLELGRPLCELFATGHVLAAYGVRVAWSTRIRAQLLAYALDVVMPAGRTVGEAGKATVLAPEVGIDRSVAIGAAGQTLTLLSSAAWALLGLVVASFARAHEGIVVATVVYTLATVSLASLIFVAARLSRPWPWLTRIPHVLGSAQQLDHLLRAPSRHLVLSAIALLGGRVLQAIQLTVLLAVLGAAPSLPLTAVATNLYVVSAAAGELVPAQLGVVDGAFAIASSSFGIAPNAMLGVSLGLHAAQLLGAAIAALAFAFSGVVRGTRAASLRSNA